MRSPGTGGKTFLKGGGETGALIASMDWSEHPLGPPESWPQSLQTALSICLSSRQSLILFWGPELYSLYNDAFVAISGDKHPASMGQPGRVMWAEIWDVVGPMLQGVLTGGEATWEHDQLLVVNRFGFPEETYFTYSYSAIRDETRGVGGVFTATTETTGRVLTARRLSTLKELAGAATATSPLEACRSAVKIIEGNRRDIPFLEVHLPAQKGGFYGAISSGVEERFREWPLEEVANSGQHRVVPAEDGFAPGPWPEPPERACLLPVAREGSDTCQAILVAGVSSRLAWNEDYLDFLRMVAGHIGTALDNANAYQQERKRAEALAELERAKTAFFSNISHEFRTPLTMMLAPLQDALEDEKTPLPPVHRERLELIRRSGHRLQKLVNNLLDFSRLEAGRTSAEYRPTEISQVTAELAGAFRSAMEQAGLELDVDCPELPERVYVDLDMWEKIVLNLLSNAFKYTFSGKVSVRTNWSEGEGAVLTVSDTGVGIPGAELPHIFERFHRVPNSQGRSLEGSGIGLALVAELVRMHKGSIDCRSDLGEGTTFRVVLPSGSCHLPPDQVVEDESREVVSDTGSKFAEEATRWLPAEQEHRSDLNGAGRGRILLVDDNSDVREYIRRLLEEMGFAVEVRNDGLEALKSARGAPPDLVLSDVMMPGLDGFELLRELRKDEVTSWIPVVLLSARAGEQARVQGLEAGADDYLVKPFHARELQVRVATLLEAHREKRRLQAELEERLRSQTFQLALSEARYRSLVEASPVVVYRCQSESPFLVEFVSAPIEQLTGYSPEVFYRDGISWVGLICPDDLPLVRENIEESHRTHQPFEFEARVMHRDGSFRVVHARGRLQAAESGGPPFIEGICFDVTESKKAEEAEVARREAEAANKAKSEFLATLSHELRTPLNGIVGMAGLLTESTLAPEQQEYASTIMGCARVLLDTISDVLDVSKIEAGKFELENRPFSLRELVSESLDGVRGLAETKDLLLEYEIAEDVPDRFIGDPVRLRQVFLNFLGNGIKFTPRGSVTLRGSYLGPSEEDHLLRFEVEDTGIGIAATDIPKLFKPFSQLQTEWTRTVAGTGLGLSICRRIVELMNGELKVESTPGEGSTFWFIVRLRWDGAEVDEKEPSVEREHGGTARILVVEDNPVNRRVLSLQLERLGYLVEVAGNGLEAVEQTAKNQYDLVLMDCQMPEMDGWEATRRIRARGPGPVIIALTAYAQPAEREKSMDAGMQDFLVKPVVIEHLGNVIRRWLGTESRIG